MMHLVEAGSPRMRARYRDGIDRIVLLGQAGEHCPRLFVYGFCFSFLFRCSFVCSISIGIGTVSVWNMSDERVVHLYVERDLREIQAVLLLHNFLHLPEITRR
jgi:hypothetical protein